MRMDGQANMKKVTFAFRNFVNASKKKSCHCRSLYQKCVTVFLHATSSFTGSRFLFKNFSVYLSVCVRFRHVTASFPCPNLSTVICHFKLCSFVGQYATLASLLQQTGISQYRTVRSVCLWVPLLLRGAFNNLSTWVRKKQLITKKYFLFFNVVPQ